MRNSILNAFHPEAYLYSSKSSLPSESSFYASQPEIDATWMYTTTESFSLVAKDKSKNLEFAFNSDVYLNIWIYTSILLEYYSNV